MKVMNPKLTRVARRLDWLWKIFCWVVKIPTEENRAEIKSILLIDLHLIGDIVLLIPLIEALKKRHEQAAITLVAGPWAKSILTGDAAPDRFVEYTAPWVKKPKSAALALREYRKLLRELRSEHWDVGIDVRGDVRQIFTLYMARCINRIGFDFTGGGALLTIILPDDGKLRHILEHHQQIAAALDAWNGVPFVPSLRVACSGTQGFASNRYIGFHFGASLPLRQFSPGQCAELLNNYKDTDEQIVYFCSSDMESYRFETFKYISNDFLKRITVWRGSLEELITKISQAKRLYAMDSGPAHLAAALNVETIVFFGPNKPDFTGPRGKQVAFVQDNDIPCRPCGQRVCINSVHQACLLKLPKLARLEDGKKKKEALNT